MHAEPMPALPTRPRGARLWWQAARPRTLSIAATPVLVGTTLAWAEGAAMAWAPALAALLCALLIQAATNLHNDASDFERGVDGPGRIGPLRITAAGWARPAQVRGVAMAVYTLALAVGIYLVGVGGWPILVIGLASLGAGWSYSGGARPVSHTAGGELMVFVFFGLVAVGGSHWLQSGQLTLAAGLAGAAVGALGAAVLLVNNLRDLAPDTAAGRRTLAAVLGPARARRLHAALMLAPFAAPLALVFAEPQRGGALLAWLALPLCIAAARGMARADGPALNAVLAATVRAQFFFGLLLAVGVML